MEYEWVGMKYLTTVLLMTLNVSVFQLCTYMACRWFLDSVSCALTWHLYRHNGSSNICCLNTKYKQYCNSNALLSISLLWNLTYTFLCYNIAILIWFLLDACWPLYSILYTINYGILLPIFFYIFWVPIFWVTFLLRFLHFLLTYLQLRCF